MVLSIFKIHSEETGKTSVKTVLVPLLLTYSAQGSSIYVFADTYSGQRFNLSVTCSRLLCFYKEIYVFDYSI